LQGGAVCFSGISVQGCVDDSVCPLGSACLANNLCSVPCPG
jgi:hypothetical protein